MEFLTNDKLVIVGAGGMIGSNMVQSALMLGLTPNICLYDIFEPGVHGVFDEIQQCAFPGVNVTYTVNPEEAFTGAKYIISSGGAPRKEGMTREDLLKGNCKIAAEFGDNIKKYCPEVEHVVVIFNPADVTALTALIHSGLKPNQLTSLAALDSTRLQQALALEFGVQQDKVTGAHTYGGHELHDGGGLFVGLPHLGQLVQTLVRHGHDAAVGLDGAERIVGRLRVLGGGDGVEQGGLADVRQADDT